MSSGQKLGVRSFRNEIPPNEWALFRAKLLERRVPVGRGIAILVRKVINGEIEVQEEGNNG